MAVSILLLQEMSLFISCQRGPLALVLSFKMLTAFSFSLSLHIPS